MRWLISIEEEPFHDSKLFTYSLNDNKAKSQVIKITLVCVDVIYSHFRISVNCLNHFGWVSLAQMEIGLKHVLVILSGLSLAVLAKFPHRQLLRYSVQPTASCRALLSTGRASALAMTRVWFLYLERVQERNLKSKISDWKQKLPITCVSHICGFFHYRGIRWPLAFPGHVHRYILHYITEITVLLILHGY